MKYRFSLYLKLLTGYLVFALLCFSFVNFYSATMINQLIIQDEAKHLHKQAGILAEYYSEQFSAFSPDSASGTNESDERYREMYETVLDRFRIYAQADNAHIWYLDAAGSILIDSENDSITDPVATEFNAADFNHGYYICAKYLPGVFSSQTEESILTYTTVTTGFKVTGYVVIAVPQSQIDEQCYYLQSIVYVTVLVLIGLSLIVMVIFSIVVYKPLRKITKAANEYAAGNFTIRPAVKGHDEMGYLAATLSFMANEIEEAGEGQRKLVSNISHDFRSPLTSIKGYLEAILDGTIPPEMEKKYLGIVLDETERLTKLSQNLLTLNTTDSKTKSAYLNYTVFDINHSIRKVSASFEGICMKREIRFELIFSDLTLYVYADAEKIQQVLYNLVDNAIKFSNPKGVITIETFSKHGKAFISVKDMGIGIPGEDLNKIWNRFYKSDASRGKDKKGTGLGLAITKDIIQAHNESIDCISTPGVGTTFTFRLPLANSRSKEVETGSDRYEK